MEKVVCKNSATGRTMVFEYGDTVFLEGVDDIGAANFTISTSKNTGVDGESVEGESQNARHPVIRAYVFSDYDVIRDQLDAVFQEGVDGTLEVCGTTVPAVWPSTARRAGSCHIPALFES